MKTRTVDHSKCRAFGESKSLLYKLWQNMLGRVKENYHERAIYHDRGIAVAPEYYHYPRFREDALALGYQDGLSIDRIDNDKGYFKDNLRFVTRKEQNRNKRNNLRLSDGRLLIEIAEEENCPYSYATLRYHYHNGTIYDLLAEQPITNLEQLQLAF